MNVDLHAGQGVDQGNGVRSGRLCRPCHLRDVGDIGAQLHDDRLSGLLLNGGGDIVQAVRLLAEGDGSLLHIRTGDVDLQHVHGCIRKALHHFQIILQHFAADIDDYLRIILLQKGQVPLQEYVDARVLQADGVKHAAVDLRHSGGGIAGPGHVCHTLCHHGAQTVQIHKLAVFHAGSKGAGCGHDRIFQFNSRQIHRCFHQISTSFASKTGPSVQIRALFTWEWASFFVVLHTQPRQAPTPQAMRSSREM